MSRRPVSMSAIFEYFEEKKLIQKGENSVSSGYVQKMMYDNELSVVRGEVQASMKRNTYTVEVFLNDGQISNCTCTCPKGLDTCHHMAALAIFAHSNLSATDMACKWSKPKSSKNEAPLTAEKCFENPSLSSFNPLEADITEESVTKFMEDLKLCGPTGLGWILSPEPQITDENIVPIIEDLIFSENFLKADNKAKYLSEKLILADDRIKTINEQTIGQANNPLWLIARKHRLTASNFGKIIKAHRRSRFPPSLFQTLTGSYNLDGIKQIQWGRNHESVALKSYEKIHQVQIQSSGIWLHNCGYLGATPDGILDEDTIIEVKCPYTFRDQLFKDCLLNNNNYILKFDGEKFLVNTDHDYYYQIQGQLEIMKKKQCILILWTSKDYIEFCIENVKWGKNIDILSQFYFDRYIPYLLN